MSNYFLGFDLSTQQIKCLATNDQLEIVAQVNVEFDKELSHYNTHGGVYQGPGNGVVDCPVAMWIEALDKIFEKLSSDTNIDLSNVRAISGSCQQHGSVYWTEEGIEALTKLSANLGSLSDQLIPDAFARPTAPNWQDHSTAKQCEILEKEVGGPDELATITGSRAHLRFTGPQIMRIKEDEPINYQNSLAITMISNFLSSVIAGKITPIEESEACGMNLYDIKKREFSRQLMDIIDPDALASKIMSDKTISCDKPKCLGLISPYFVVKYGLNPQCKIFPFTGDNMATICSLPLRKDDVMISLGTSTTVLMVTDQYRPSANYHLFIHPTIPNHYMAMICYSNGALARERVRDSLNEENGHDSDPWRLFDEAVLDPKLDTSNKIGVYFPLAEIVPRVKATEKRAIFDIKTGAIQEYVEKFNNRFYDAKMIVESQALSCRARIAPLLSGGSTTGKKVRFDYEEIAMGEYLEKKPKRVFYVGGGSKNNAIVAKFSEVLGASQGNYRLETPNSCALGGCFKAHWSYLYTADEPYDKFLESNFPWHSLEQLPTSDDRDWLSFANKIVPLSSLEAQLVD